MAMGFSTHGFLGLMLLVISMLMLTSSLQATAIKFNVGGKYGWVQNPKESYNKWAERTRFQVNDTLYFKTHRRHDAVLVVDKESYFACNTKNPIHKLRRDHTEFVLNRSGPFYFIGARAKHCKRGQKLIVVVLSPNHHKRPHHSPVSPPHHAPHPAPHHAPSHAPAHAPHHAPAHHAPAPHAPHHAPAHHAPAPHAPHHAPAHHAPAPHAPHHAPAHHAPAPHAPHHAPAHHAPHHAPHAPAHAPSHVHSWSQINAPAPGPSSAASSRFGGSVAAAMGFGISVVLVLSSFI